MDIEQLSFEYDRPDPDPERDLRISVVIEVPFYGKRTQALKFVNERLPDILLSGITNKAKLTAVRIESV